MSAMMYVLTARTLRGTLLMIDISRQFEYPGVRQYIRKIASDFGWDWVSIFSTHRYC